VHGLALFQNFYPSFNTEPYSLSFQPLEGFFHGFASEAKGSVVHGNHPLSAEFDEASHGLLGAGMDRPVGIREVGSDRQQRDLGFQPGANLAKSVKLSGVSRVINPLAATFNNIPAVPAMHITKHTCAPVFAWGHGDFKSCHLGLVPPLQAMNLRKAEPLHQVLDAFRHNDFGCLSGQLASGANHASQGSHIQMIHVRVGQQNQIDGRQFLHAQPWFALSSEHDKPFGKDGIDQHLAPIDLEQKR
jgi:hypothetical protein